MEEVFSPVRITERVWWVGAIDWSLRNFHGYATHRGTTYNAYLIKADPVILVDTVKKPFLNEMLSRIKGVVDPGEIKVIISNHSEMDHSGCIPEMLEITGAETLYASPMGVKALEAHFHMGREIREVKDGETLKIGNVTFTFFETRMLHWPDSMFTYFHEEGVLFSNDVFGMHLASEERFADEVSAEEVEYECAKYFANILLPYAQVALKVTQRIREFASGHPINVIATDHGPVWRKDVMKIVDKYEKWAQQKPTMKAVISYDTMYGSTEKMAWAIAEGLSHEGVHVKVLPLSGSHRSDVATELLTAGAFIVGSPTINSNMFPTVADLLTYIRGLKARNKIGAVFGSYGWNAQGFQQVKKELESMGVELVGEGIRVQYVPRDDDLKRCVELGREVGRRLKEKCGKEC